jgi:hypothetical protein
MPSVNAFRKSLFELNFFISWGNGNSLCCCANRSLSSTKTYEWNLLTELFTSSRLFHLRFEFCRHSVRMQHAEYSCSDSEQGKCRYEAVEGYPCFSQYCSLKKCTRITVLFSYVVLWTVQFHGMHSRWNYFVNPSRTVILNVDPWTGYIRKS